MTKWEYLSGSYEDLSEGSDTWSRDMLNRLGEQGWELVSVAALPDFDDIVAVYYFKRPKRSR